MGKLFTLPLFFIPLGWSGQARQTKKERKEAKRDYSTRDLTNFSICT
jgi:hypothetical protein